MAETLASGFITGFAAEKPMAAEDNTIFQSTDTHERWRYVGNGWEYLGKVAVTTDEITD